VLITFLRVMFVLLAVLVGLTSGRYFYQGWADLPQWFGGAMGFAVAITLIAAEIGFRKRFTRSLVAFLVGAGGGLLLSFLVLAVLNLAIQDEQMRRNLDVPLALIITYLVIVTVLRNADRFRVVVPFVEFRSDSVEEGTRVLDGSALADGRILGLHDAGLLDQRLLVPRSLLVYAESQTTSSSEADRVRAQRILEHIRLLRERVSERLIIDNTEIPTAQTHGDVVLGLARLENARLVTADHDLAQRARAEGIQVLDLQLLSGSLAPTVRPGETLQVAIEKRGEADRQGVGYLDDGSMVVVAGAENKLGETVSCTVLRLHQTANGRMIFAELRAATEAQTAV